MNPWRGSWHPRDFRTCAIAVVVCGVLEVGVLYLLIVKEMWL